MKYIINITIIAFLFLSISCTKTAEKTAPDNRPAIKATVATVNPNKQASFISSSGKVSAIKSATISTRIMGFITSIPVKVGDKVSKGQIILRINSADLSAKNTQVTATITEATVAMNNAEKDYNRFKALYKNNSASQKEMDDISANYAMAKARVTAAKGMLSGVNAQLSYTNIRAPFSGIITNSFVKQGDMANPGMPLITLEQPNNYEILTMVSENIIGKLSKKMKVDILLKSSNKKLKGLVSEISTSSNNTGGQYLVKIKLDASKKNVLSGMYVSVQFPIASKKNATNKILIPTSALVKKGELVGVYTLNKDNIALLRWLRVGRTYGENIQILSGLSEGESYVLTTESPIHNGVKLLIKQ